MSALPSPDPNALDARCPRCGTRLWDWRDGSWSLITGRRGAGPPGGVLIRRGDGSLVAACPTLGCRADVPVPFLALVDPPVPTEHPSPRPRRVVVRRTRIPVDSG